MAKVMIVLEDGPAKDGKENVQIAVAFDPPVKNPRDSRTWTGAQRIGNNAIEYALRRKGVKRTADDVPLPKRVS